MKQGDKVVVFTELRGIHFGELAHDYDGGDTVLLNNCRHGYYLGTKQGVYESATNGPPIKESKIGPAVASQWVRKVANVALCSADAAKAWEAAQWK